MSQLVIVPRLIRRTCWPDPSLVRTRLSRTFFSSSSRNAEATDEELGRTRNIGIIAHIDAGKTTTTERMLYYSGMTRRIGDVDDGSTVTDFLPAERARGITIQSAAVTFHWPPLPAANGHSPALRSEKSPDQPVPTTPVLRSLSPHTINLIDTPGHADFTFEVVRSLRILDGAVCILDSVAGVEAQTEKVWQQASNYRIPRIAYVNKLDRDGASFGNTVKEIGSRLHGWPAVCQIPWWEGGKGKFIGVGDIVKLQGMRWKDGGDGKAVKSFSLKELTDAKEDYLANEIRKARVALVELLSEHDAHMVNQFLECNEDHLAIPSQEITDSLRRCVLDGSANVIPVFAGASFKNIGVQPLLDAVVDLLPNPTERPDAEVSLGAARSGLNDLLTGKVPLVPAAMDPKQKRRKDVSTMNTHSTSPISKLEGCALAFKVVNDPRRGVLVYVRVYSGIIDRNASLFNTNLQIAERAPRLLKMYASDAQEIPSIPAGQIGVIPGLKHTRTGDTLISYPGLNPKNGPPAPLNTLQLRPIDVPPPVFFASIEPHSLGEEKQMQDSLALLLREDPSLHITVDEDSGQTLLSGMGELHLEIARDRLVDDLKAKASMGRIEIGYRECILSSSTPQTHVFNREIAGKKGIASCTASVEPLPSNEGPDGEPPDLQDGNVVKISFLRDDESGQAIETSKPSLPSHLSHSMVLISLTNGALAALARGPQHAFPLHNTHVILTIDTKSQIFGADTTISALTSAARLATQAALKSAAQIGGTALMEPVMNVIISVDEASLGAVVHDIESARGGHVSGFNDDSAESPATTQSSYTTTSSTEDRPVIDPRRIYAPPDPFANTSIPATDHYALTTGDGRQRSITARVPLKEMVGYLKHLRSLTAGRGTFVMSVDKFERMGGMREKVVLSEMRGL